MKSKKTVLFAMTILILFLCMLSARSITSYAEDGNLRQTSATPNSVTVKWNFANTGKPVIVYSYKLEWKVGGKKRYVVLNESKNKYTIKGLQPNSTYTVSLKYRKENSDGSAKWVSYGKIEVLTDLGMVSLPENKYEYYRGVLVYKGAVTKGTYQYIVNPGPKRLYSTPKIDEYGLYSIDKYFNMRNLLTGKTTILRPEGSYTCSYPNGEKGVIFVCGPGSYGLLTVMFRPIRDNGPGWEWTGGGWTVTRVVEDPVFTTKYDKNKIKVTINPLKYVDSYEVYIARAKGISSDFKASGWEKAGTVRAKSGKKVSFTIKKYKKKAFGKKANYAVKVVAVTSYKKGLGNHPQWVDK